MYLFFIRQSPGAHPNVCPSLPYRCLSITVKSHQYSVRPRRRLHDLSSSAHDLYCHRVRVGALSQLARARRSAVVGQREEPWLGGFFIYLWIMNWEWYLEDITQSQSSEIPFTTQQMEVNIVGFLNKRATQTKVSLLEVDVET